MPPTYFINRPTGHIINIIKTTKMKTFLFSAVAAIGMSLCSQSAQARSWRVNSNPDAKANFASINDAMASLDVFNGDTIYLDPGCVLGAQEINKSVTVIGTGYDLNDNSFAKEATIDGHLTIKASDVKVEGVYMYGIRFNKAGIKNIVIERCKILTGDVGNGSGSNEYSESKFLSCFILGKLECHDYFYRASNIEISNCIILGGINNFNASTIRNNVIVVKGTSSNSSGDQFYVLKDITNSYITNNVIINTNTEYSVGEDQRPYYYKNNTIENTAIGDNNTISNNVLSTEAQHAFANYPNNKFIGATAADIFTLTGAADAMYKLKEDSPAIGYGTNGYDCGAFSGPYPYVLSGRPRFLPYIYEAIIPNQPTDGKLNVTLKIKTQNE